MEYVILIMSNRESRAIWAQIPRDERAALGLVAVRPVVDLSGFAM